MRGMDQDAAPDTAEDTAQDAAQDAVPAASALPAGQRWRTGRIGLPSMIGLLLVIGAGGLAAASINGWGGIAVVVVFSLVFIGLIASWAVTD